MSRVDDRTKAVVAPATKVIMSTVGDPREDARKEREGASFDSWELAKFMHDGEDRLIRKAELVEYLQQQPWGDKSRRYFLTRNEEYVGGLNAVANVWKLMHEKKIGVKDGMDMRYLLYWPGGLELHLGMFIPTILAQGTPEQQAHWLPLCNELRIIGTYAQTELGHGTFVRGLETVAVYDESSEEFVVHSPTLTSTKWWPGGLGKTATHVILMARLFTRGRDHGPHAFVMQIRDIERHTPVPGVTVGDIGPKMGYNGVDNGFLSFDHVRIPRDAMLQRFAKISADGVYTPPPPTNSKASYATMVYVRATIVQESGDILGRAATIATRYAAVRRQTAPAPGARELQVLDYDNVAQTLLPLVASAYALTFAGRAMMAMYKQFDSDRGEGEFGTLPELHALSSGLKALCTDTTALGVETARRTCGGHGYSLLSGLPTLFNSYVQNVTWEGDNNVLYLQTARYLLKARAGVAAGQPVSGSASYLNAPHARGSRSGVASAAAWRCPNAQLEALRHVATRLVDVAVRTVMTAAGGKLVFEGRAWTDSTVDLIRAARAHSHVVLVGYFAGAAAEAADAAAAGKLPATAARAVDLVRALHGVSLLGDAAGDLLEDGFADGAQAAALREAKRSLVRELRPDAVALVDAFAYEDYLLNSALGRKDGDVYRALLDMAQGSPLNDSPEGPAWQPVLKPLMAGRSKF